MLDKNAVVIDSSTIDAATTQKVAAKATELGVKMMDCPVSGGVAAAKAGTLAFMCGGTEATFAEVKPILEAMGKIFFMPVITAQGRLQKCAITCCSRST